MEKSIRILILLTIPALLLIFISVVWAAPPLMPLPPDQQEAESDRQLEPTPMPLEAFNAEQLDKLELHSSGEGRSILVNSTVFFTTSLPAGTISATPDKFVWAFGDGQTGETVKPQASNVYTRTGVFTATVIGYIGSEPTYFGLAYIFIGISVNHVYLPVTHQEHNKLTDLQCLGIDVEPADPSAGDTILLNVRFRNNTGVADGFWVDLYINPTGGRPQPNTRWGTVCDPSICPGGIAWSISNDPIYGGQTRTLRSVSSNDDPYGFDPQQTSWQGNVTLSQPGTYQLYAYVDSWDTEGSTGAVDESNENNNVCGPISVIIDPARTISDMKSKQNLLPDRSGP